MMEWDQTDGRFNAERNSKCLVKRLENIRTQINDNIEQCMRDKDEQKKRIREKKKRIQKFVAEDKLQRDAYQAIE